MVIYSQTLHKSIPDLSNTILNTSRVTYSLDDLMTFLDSVEFPTLTTEARQTLENPITLKEVQGAIKSLQAGKTPGFDRIPMKFYKTNLNVVCLFFISRFYTALVGMFF